MALYDRPQFDSPRRVHLLGATGSVGRAAADVIASAPQAFDVGLVTANTDAAGLAQVARRLGARNAVIVQEDRLAELQAGLAGSGCHAHAGRAALNDAARESADLTLAAIVGMAGLESLAAAMGSSRIIAIANKEPLVAAGHLMMDLAQRTQTTILPVDSEHNALFQLLHGRDTKDVRTLTLTASGGPFLGRTLAEMAAVTVEQALRHPTWRMGAKISIDSATLMNKGLEIIEAHVLFGMPASALKVMVHPQSVVHGLVELCDGSVLAQMAAHDMRTPLAHVLAWPQRMNTPGERLDLAQMSRLEFFSPDHKNFPALDLCYGALAAGPSACLVLNAANEVAVEAFLNGQIGFTEISAVCSHMLQTEPTQKLGDLDAVFEYDALVRSRTCAYIKHPTQRYKQA
jgi:1-deoxy-D-xylulose-5-phosphate reductoisomerase